MDPPFVRHSVTPSEARGLSRGLKGPLASLGMTVVGI
jgi:hypothetical protein